MRRVTEAFIIRTPHILISHSRTLIKMEEVWDGLCVWAGLFMCMLHQLNKNCLKSASKWIVSPIFLVCSAESNMRSGHWNDGNINKRKGWEEWQEEKWPNIYNFGLTFLIYRVLYFMTPRGEKEGLNHTKNWEQETKRGLKTWGNLKQTSHFEERRMTWGGIQLDELEANCIHEMRTNVCLSVPLTFDERTCGYNTLGVKLRKGASLQKLIRKYSYIAGC